MNASPNKGIEINMIDKEFPKLDVLKMIHTNNDPISILPVSPMKILAGLQFQTKNPINALIIGKNI